MVSSPRRLKAAKEKLSRLQELVSMVQNSPDVMGALPDDLAQQLAAGVDSDLAQIPEKQALAITAASSGLEVPYDQR